MQSRPVNYCILDKALIACFCDCPCDLGLLTFLLHGITKER